MEPNYRLAELTFRDSQRLTHDVEVTTCRGKRDTDPSKEVDISVLTWDDNMVQQDKEYYHFEGSLSEALLKISKAILKNARSDQEIRWDHVFPQTTIKLTEGDWNYEL